MRQTRVVWSISYCPFFTPSSQNILVDFILNFLKHSSSSILSRTLLVTPIICFPNSLRYSLTTLGESLSGSTETNTIFIFIYAPSGKFLIMRYTDERQQRVLGQISGQFVYPKQIRQQFPCKFLLETGWPSVPIKVQSPPISDYFCLSSFKPEISFSMVSIFSELVELAQQKKQMSAPASAAKPAIPTLVTPSQLTFFNQSSSASYFNLSCYCIIQAQCLFFGVGGLLSENERALKCLRNRVALVLCRQEGKSRVWVASKDELMIFLIIQQYNWDQQLTNNEMAEQYQKLFNIQFAEAVSAPHQSPTLANNVMLYLN